MNFFIRQNSTLPILKVQVVKDSRNNFREFDNGLSGATITFSMYEENTGTYRILDRPAFIELVPDSSPAEYYVYYPFRKTDTKKIGGYIGEFKISYPTSEIILPLREKLYINITESFVDSDTCCRPNRGQRPIIMPTQTAKPTRTPSSTPTSTPTTSVTLTPTPTQTNTLTAGLTLTPTPTITQTPTLTLTQSLTLTPTPTPTMTQSVTSSLTPTPSQTETLTPTTTPTSTI